MKIKLTIERADNGMIVWTDEGVVVIENTHSTTAISKKDNLINELGRIFFLHVSSVMNEELTNKVEVEIDEIKTE